MYGSGSRLISLSVTKPRSFKYLMDLLVSERECRLDSATPGVSVVRAGVKAREPRDLRRFWAAQSFQSFEFNRFNRLSVDVDSSIMPGGGEKVSRCGSTNFGRQRPREATGSRGRRVRPARPRESRLLCVCRDPPTQSHCFAVLRDRCPTVLYECTVWSCRAAGARGGILTTAVG